MCPYQLQMRDSQALFGQDLLLIWTDWTKKHRVSIFDWLASNFAGLEFHLWSLKVASFITLTINSFHCYASSTVDPLLGGHLRTNFAVVDLTPPGTAQPRFPSALLGLLQEGRGMRSGQTIKALVNL